MATAEVFQLCLVIIGVITLVIKIQEHNDKKK